MVNHVLVAGVRVTFRGRVPAAFSFPMDFAFGKPFLLCECCLDRLMEGLDG